MTPNLLMLAASLLLFAVFYSTVSYDLRHPVNLYLLAWSTVFVLLQLPLINYVEIMPFTYLYIGISMVLFVVIGVLAGSVRRKSRQAAPERRGFFISTPLLLGLGSVSLATALLYYQSTFGLVRLLTDPGGVRAEDSGGTGLLGLLIFMPTVVFTLLIIQARLQRRLHWLTGVYLVAVVAYVAILPERSSAVNTLIWTVLSLLATNPQVIHVNRSFFRRYGLLFAALPIVVIGFFLIVSQRTQKVLYLENIGYALNTNTGLPKEIFDPFIYMTGSIPALSTVLTTAHQQGEWLKFNPEKTAIFPLRLYQLVTGGQNDERLTSNAEYASIPFKFNTYTWLYEAISDYGILGGLLYVALYAIAAGLAWAYRQWTISVFSCYLYGWAGTAVIFSVLTNKFSSIYYTYSVLIVMALLVLTNGLNLLYLGALADRQALPPRPRRPLTQRGTLEP